MRKELKIILNNCSFQENNTKKISSYNEFKKFKKNLRNLNGQDLIYFSQRNAAFSERYKEGPEKKINSKFKKKSI